MLNQLLQGVKSSTSDFRIRLTYEHVSATSADNRFGKNQCNKRIKSGMYVLLSLYLPVEAVWAAWMGTNGSKVKTGLIQN